MEIYCKHKPILERAVLYANKLGIAERCSYKHIQITASFRQQAIIEHAREYEDVMHMNIYIKFNEERYVSLAHEMIHARQILSRVPIDENEAYLLENTADND